MVGVQELPRVPGTSLTDVFPKQVPFESGHLLVPEGPGLGIEFDEEAFGKLEPYSPPTRGTYFVRDDGAYTNW
jgi:L-alanine-DL-glutamate epimerase-like enolase superfamily enzyme